MFSTYVHTGIFTDVLMTCIFMFMPVNSLVLVFCMAVLGQPACYVQVWARFVYNAYPVLVNLQHDPLQLLVQCGLWSVMMHTTSAEQQWWNFCSPCSILWASYSILLCCAVQHSIYFFWSRPLGTVLHCLALCHAHNS